jgi:hypothetical protein
MMGNAIFVATESRALESELLDKLKESNFGFDYFSLSRITSSYLDTDLKESEKIAARESLRFSQFLSEEVDKLKVSIIVGKPYRPKKFFTSVKLPIFQVFGEPNQALENADLRTIHSQTGVEASIEAIDKQEDEFDNLKADRQFLSVESFLTYFRNGKNSNSTKEKNAEEKKRSFLVTKVDNAVEKRLVESDNSDLIKLNSIVFSYSDEKTKSSDQIDSFFKKNPDHILVCDYNEYSAIADSILDSDSVLVVVNDKGLDLTKMEEAFSDRFAPLVGSLSDGIAALRDKKSIRGTRFTKMEEKLISPTKKDNTSFDRKKKLSKETDNRIFNLAITNIRDVGPLAGNITYFDPNNLPKGFFTPEELKYLESRAKFSKPEDFTRMFSDTETFAEANLRIHKVLQKYKAYFREKELDKLSKAYHKVNSNVGAIRGDLSDQNRIDDPIFKLVKEHEALGLRKRMIEMYELLLKSETEVGRYTSIRKSSNIGYPSFSYSAAEKREVIEMFKRDFGISFDDEDLKKMMQAFRAQGKASKKFVDKTALIGGNLLAFFKGAISFDEMIASTAQATREVMYDFKSVDQGHLRSITIAPFKLGLLVLGSVTLLREAFHFKDGRNNHRVGKQWNVRLSIFGTRSLLSDYRDNDTKLSTTDMFDFISSFYPLEAERLKGILSDLHYTGVDWIDNENYVYYILRNIKPANASGILFLTAIANYFIHSTANLVEVMICMKDIVNMTVPNPEFSLLIYLAKLSGTVINNSDDIALVGNVVDDKGDINPHFVRLFGEASFEEDAVGQSVRRDRFNRIIALGRHFWTAFDFTSKWERRDYFKNKLRSNFINGAHGTISMVLAQVMSLEGLNRSDLEKRLTIANEVYNTNFKLDDFYKKEFLFEPDDNDEAKVAMKKAAAFLGLDESKLFYELKSSDYAKLPAEILDALWIVEDTLSLINPESIIELKKLNERSVWRDHLCEEEKTSFQLNDDDAVYPELYFRVELTKFSEFKKTEDFAEWLELGKFGFEPSTVNSVFWKLLSKNVQKGIDLKLGLLNTQSDYNHVLFIFKNYHQIDETYFISEDDISDLPMSSYIDINSHNAVVRKIIESKDDILKKHRHSQKMRSGSLFRTWKEKLNDTHHLDHLLPEDIACKENCDLLKEISSHIDLGNIDHMTRHEVINQLYENDRYLKIAIEPWRLGIPNS